ncbi:phosphomannomutase/phosphoglucomutase [Allopusillimonas ginsengisoli]|uniref:phosphomannomutase/phosphoglucomutase n=1 Tax=Allopusillimonas ginsengisoli TaxID=453575 RepID=UPI003CC8AD41
MTNTALPSAVFKAYDIRGIVPEQLNPDFARRLGLALAEQARSLHLSGLVVGYDGRLSSPELSAALQDGILAGGIDTIDLGMVHTPLVYFAAYRRHTGSGVAITGSHNPPDYNGFKIMMDGKALYGDGIQALAGIMAAPEPIEGIKPGTRQEIDLVDDYVQFIVETVKLSRPMKIAIDCGNGVGGKIAPKLYEALGCTVDQLYCDVDGTFPNHHPDPADPHNLVALIKHVQETDCELGLAFDGDADRIGVVTKSGQIIWPDRQLILFAQDVLRREPGSTIIFDVKCSRHVAREIKHAGGKPLMWQTGHSLIKAKLAETGAPLAGEMSGHIFFKERWFGFDDGLYAGARLLEILSGHENPSEVLEALPQDISTPEIKMEMKEGESHALVARLQAEGQFPTATSLSTIDGVRAEYKHGFGLARASNTTPVIVLRFEGDSQEDLDRIRDEFRNAIQTLAPGLTPSF